MGLSLLNKFFELLFLKLFSFVYDGILSTLSPFVVLNFYGVYRFYSSKDLFYFDCIVVIYYGESDF